MEKIEISKIDVGKIGVYAFTLKDDRDTLSMATVAIVGNKKGLHAKLEDVFTPEEFRGKGYATRLLEGIFEEVRNMGCYKMTFTCRPDLIKFYERFGAFCRSNPDGSESVSMRIDFN